MATMPCSVDDGNDELDKVQRRWKRKRGRLRERRADPALGDVPTDREDETPRPGSPVSSLCNLHLFPMSNG